VLITSLLFAVTMLQQGADTTLAVRKGQRLEATVYAGSITVKTWNRDAVRVQADTRKKDRLDVTADGSTVSIEMTGKWGPAGASDIEITMPVWMGVELSGVETDLAVDGCKCTVHGETVRGDVTVKGGEGNVSVQSVEGSVTVTDVNGRVEAQSINESVTVERVTGDLAVQTVNGDVTMVAITSGNVEASTVNGDISYDGTIQNGGRYELSTHQGDMSLTMPENANATVSVNTFNGSFESDYPVTLTGRNQRRKFSFTIGNGSARVDLESFGGDIRLARPGSRTLKSKGTGDND
jgi:DUF4097 and DUF4098 domain-containing protein YvlB